MNYKHSYSINSKTKREKIKIQTLNLKKCTEITERSFDLKTNICKFDECEGGDVNAPGCDGVDKLI